MTNEQAADIRARAIRYAKRKGAVDDIAEDFAQFIFTQGGTEYFRERWVDFLRVRFGRGKTVRPKATLAASSNFLEWKPVYSPSLPYARESFFLESLHNLDRDQRAYTILHYKWGLTMAEIGEVFGVTESSVSLRFKTVHRRLRLVVSSGLTFCTAPIYGNPNHPAD